MTSTTAKLLGLSACRAAALSTTMLTRRKSSIDGGGVKAERRRRGESIGGGGGGVFTDMINIEPTSIITKSQDLLHERAVRDLVRIASLMSMISVCLHTPETIRMWEPLNYVILVNDLLVTLIFLVEAIVTINTHGLFENAGSYLRDRWYQFEFFLLVIHMISCFVHIFELSAPSLKLIYPEWLGAFRSPRPFVFLRFIRSIVQFKLEKNRIKLIMKRSSQQIQNVTIFFMFFVFSYAIMGVQIFGRLNYHCVTANTDPNNVTIANLAIPDTMCSQKDGGGYECPGDMVCMRLQLKPQEEGFYGQFSDFASSLFTVYLAASQEGWAYVLYDCLDSFPSSLAFFYFVTLIFFLAWLVKNVFIAVITETFAEIRVQFAGQTREIATEREYTQKLEKDEDGWKLVEIDKYNRNHANNSQFLHTIVTSLAFQTVMQLLILSNAIFHATFVFYHDESDQIRKVWYYWVEVGFTILFNAEVAIKIYSFGWKSYIARGQHKFDCILCLGSTPNAIWILYETNIFTYFQVFRIARLIKASPMLEDFVYKIFGPGKKLGGLIVFTCILLIVSSAISLQLFCYVPNLNKFTNFATAFMTMFQIITQEGWTDVVIEILRTCNEQAVPFVAIYFVGYHLLVTLIVLSLFVAVILDNLEMDEELKKVKQLKAREQDTIKTTLPMRLRIFNRFPTAPTMVRLKKVSSEFPLPKIRDSFTRQFADEFFEAVDDPMQEYGCRQKSMLTTKNAQKGPSKESKLTTTVRHTGQLSNRSILTYMLTESNKHRALFSESNQHLASLTRTNTNSKHHKSGALSSSSATRRGLASLKGAEGGFKENGDLRPEDTARKVEKHGEIDIKAIQMKRAHAEITRNRIEEEMRENHPMFDRPLFLVGRESSLRRMCQLIAHSRHCYDRTDQQHRKHSTKYKQIHDFLAIMTYLDWTMVIVTTFSCCSMLWESPWPTTGENLIFNNFYLQISEYLFVFAMSFELVVKCIANGLFFTPKALVTDVGDVMTIFIYLTSLLFLVWMPTHIEINSWAQLLMICRALRPLRVYALVPHIRRVVVELCRGFREILLVTILLIVLMFIFASFGVQLVGGKLATCNDRNITRREDCHGIFEIQLFVTRMEVHGKNEDMHPRIYVPRVWRNPRNFNFDHIGNAMLALFETLSYKGWNVVRDVLLNRHGSWAVLFIHIYVFIGCMIGLTLFVGVVVANYTENRGTALLTVDQRRWHDLKARLKMAQPLHVPPKPPESAKLRCYLYDLTTSRWFKQLFAALVVINSFTLVIPWNVTEENDRKFFLISLTVISALCNLLFTIECLLKMIAFTISGFWQSRRNRIDLIITILGINWIVFHFLFQLPAKMGGISDWKRLTYTYGYLVVILRFFTIAGRKSTLKMLMLTVVMSMVRSSFIIAAMFLLVLFYANAGVVLFGMVKYGQAVGKHVNFRNGREALVVLFRSVTGEDWNDIMHDCMRAPPFCNWHPGLSYWQTDCGNYFGAIFYFCSFYLIITYIVLNLLVAIIMENFSLFYSSEEDAILSYVDIRNFQLVWNMVDIEQKRSIPVRRVKFLLRLLKGRLEVDEDGSLFKCMCHEMERLHNGDDVSFHDVLNMLSYRSVNIHKSLQLEELLQREELEYIIEEEVAKHTIRTWLERCLKNIKAKQNNSLGKVASLGSTFNFAHTPEILNKGVLVTEPSPETDTILIEEPSLGGSTNSNKKKQQQQQHQKTQRVNSLVSGDNITPIDAVKKSVKRPDKIKERRGTLRQMQMGTYDELEEVEEDDDNEFDIRRPSFDYTASNSHINDETNNKLYVSNEKQFEDVKTWWTMFD